MVVQLVLAFASLSLAIHLGHLLQAVKHGRKDPLVIVVDDFAHRQVVAAFQLSFDSVDKELQSQESCFQPTIDWIPKRHVTLTGNTRTNGTTPLRFLSVNFVCSIPLICSFCSTNDCTRSVAQFRPRIGRTLTQARSNVLKLRWYCFCNSRRRNSLRSFSHCNANRSSAAKIPTIWL